MKNTIFSCMNFTIKTRDLFTCWIIFQQNLQSFLKFTKHTIIKVPLFSFVISRTELKIYLLYLDAEFKCSVYPYFLLYQGMLNRDSGAHTTVRRESSRLPAARFAFSFFSLLFSSFLSPFRFPILLPWGHRWEKRDQSWVEDYYKVFQYPTPWGRWRRLSGTIPNWNSCHSFTFLLE